MKRLFPQHLKILFSQKNPAALHCGSYVVDLNVIIKACISKLLRNLAHVIPNITSKYEVKIFKAGDIGCQ